MNGRGRIGGRGYSSCGQQPAESPTARRPIPRIAASCDVWGRRCSFGRVPAGGGNRVDHTRRSTQRGSEPNRAVSIETNHQGERPSGGAPCEATRGDDGSGSPEEDPATGNRLVQLGDAFGGDAGLCEAEAFQLLERREVLQAFVGDVGHCQCQSGQLSEHPNID